MVTSFLFSNLVPLEVRVNNKDPQLHEYNQNISIPKNEVFQCVISAGNSFKWTFFGCVIPCVVAFKFEIPKITHFIKFQENVSDAISKCFKVLLLI